MQEHPGLHLELKSGVAVDFRNYVGILDRGDGLREAAEEALVGIQRHLLERVEQVGFELPLEWAVAKSLIRERFWAITALIDLDGHKRAKEALLMLTDGDPLTICMGDVCRIRHGERAGVQTEAGYLRFAVKGCRVILQEDPENEWRNVGGIVRRLPEQGAAEPGQGTTEPNQVIPLTRNARRRRSTCRSTHTTQLASLGLQKLREPTKLRPRTPRQRRAQASASFPASPPRRVCTAGQA